MNDKIVKFSAGLDTTDFDKSIQKLKSQINDLNKSMNMSRPGQANISPATQDAYKRASLQQERELLKILGEQEKLAEKSGKLIVNKRAEIDNLIKKQKNFVGSIEDELKLMDRLAAKRSNLNAIESKHSQLIKGRAGALGNISGEGYGPPPPSPLYKSSNRDPFIEAGIRSALPLAIGATITALAEQYISAPARAEMGRGSATQNLAGKNIQALANGDIVNQSAFMPERQKALTMAASQQKSTMALDVAKSVLPALLVTNERGRDLLMANITSLFSENLSKTYRDAYTAKNLQEFGANYQQLSEAEIQKNPLKNLAAQRLQSRYVQDLGTQRNLGLSDEGLFGVGGYEERANQGFNIDLARGMSSDILGAGGSTRAAKNSNMLGLQAQRGFDLTNAGSILGKISGTAGSSAASEAIFKKVLEAGVRAGLDNSDFREEQRKFSETAATILSTTGATTADEAEKIVQGFSKFVGNDKTIKGIEGAQGAYQQTQAFSAETGGRGGAIQFASLMNQGMGGLGLKGVGTLMEMPEKDILATNPRIISAATQMGIDPQSMVTKLKQAKRTKQLSEVGLNEQSVANLRDYMKNMSEDVNMTPEEMQQMKIGNKEAFKTYRDIEGAVTQRFGYQGPQQFNAAMRGYISGNGMPGTSEDAYDVEQKLKGKTGRMGDEITAAAGKEAQYFLENFRDFKTEITPTTEALAGLTKQLVLMAAVASGKDPNAIRNAAASLNTLQPTGSKGATRSW